MLVRSSMASFIRRRAAVFGLVYGIPAVLLAAVLLAA